MPTSLKKGRSRETKDESAKCWVWIEGRDDPYSLWFLRENAGKHNRLPLPLELSNFRPDPTEKFAETGEKGKRLAWVFFEKRFTFDGRPYDQVDKIQIGKKIYVYQ